MIFLELLTAKNQLLKNLKLKGRNQKTNSRPNPHSDSCPKFAQFLVKKKFQKNERKISKSLSPVCHWIFVYIESDLWSYKSWGSLLLKWFPSAITRKNSRESSSFRGKNFVFSLKILPNNFLFSSHVREFDENFLWARMLTRHTEAENWSQFGGKYTRRGKNRFSFYDLFSGFQRGTERLNKPKIGSSLRA